MKKKFIAMILIFSIILIQIDYNKKRADAFAWAAIPIGVKYIGAAMVAAGAVGYWTRDEEGNWGGNLYEKAMATYDVMETNMKNDLNTALAVSSFLAMSAIPGLWDFLHGKFTEPGSIVPATPILDLNSFFRSSVTFYGYLNGSTYLFAVKNNSTEILTFQCSMNTGEKIASISLYTGGYLGYWNQLTIEQQSYLLSALNSNLTGVQWLYNQTFWSNSSGTGTWPSVVSTDAIVITVNDGDSSRTINPPADPLALNQATPLSTYLDKNGVLTNPIPGVDTQAETGQIDQDRAAAAAAAAAAAISAALAAGHTQEAANAAGSAASAAIYAGQTIAEAAAAGAAAASSFVATATGTITGILQNIWDTVSTAVSPTTTATINWEPLKMSGTLFTNRFPFSIPWDIKKAILGMGEGGAPAPKWTISFPAPLNWNLVIDLALFDGIAPAVRSLELVTFMIGLLLATRKLLGGAS